MTAQLIDDTSTIIFDETSPGRDCLAEDLSLNHISKMFGSMLDT